MATSMVVERGPPPKVRTIAKLVRQITKIAPNACGAIFRIIGHSIILNLVNDVRDSALPNRQRS